MLSFAEFEREMIKERTAAGKAIARQKPGYKEGRPKQITPEIIKQIKKVLALNKLSYVPPNEVKLIPLFQ